MAHVGFVGLGTMGAPLAGHVLRREAGRGGGVAVHHRAPERVAGLLAAGAVWADSAADVARDADLVVFVLPTIADIRGTLFGPEGVLAGAGEGLVLVVSSTCSAREVRDLDREVRAASSDRVRIVDAPLSGGQEGAEAGTMSIMVGGPDEDAALVADVLGAGGRAMHLGPLGAGQVAKACNQLIVAATIACNAEVAVVAERSGLDLAKLFELLLGGYAASRVMEVKARRFVEHDHSPSGPAKFMVKDLRAYAEAAADTGTRSLLAPTLAQLFADLTEAGLGDLDTAVVQRWVEEQSLG